MFINLFIIRNSWRLPTLQLPQWRSLPPAGRGNRHLHGMSLGICRTPMRLLCRRVLRWSSGSPGPPQPCQRCECNGNIDPNALGTCDTNTGECLKCVYNTAGSKCEVCLPGKSMKLSSSIPFRQFNVYLHFGKLHRLIVTNTILRISPLIAGAVA